MPNDSSPTNTERDAVWTCAGCGVVSPNRKRSCDCATDVVCSGPIPNRISAWKIESFPSDAVGALKWIAEYTKGRDSLELSNIHECATQDVAATTTATNTERCGGEVERIRERHLNLQKLIDGEQCKPSDLAATAHRDRATLLAALAEERAKGERMRSALTAADDMLVKNGFRITAPIRIIIRDALASP